MIGRWPAPGKEGFIGDSGETGVGATQPEMIVAISGSPAPNRLALGFARFLVMFVADIAGQNGVTGETYDTPMRARLSRKIWANGLPNEDRSPKSGLRMAAEGMPFSWRWNGGTIFLNLGVIWEMPV